jgi:acetoin utilization deacetylase AcuC-like enzyme
VAWAGHYGTAVAAPLYVHHRSSLEHDTGAHPERIERIQAIERELERRDWLGFERLEAPAVSRESLLAVHTPAHVDRIEALSARGGGAIDLDTVTSAGSFEAALHAAGGAVAMVDRLLAQGGPPVAFCGLRPPGHHAETARAMGFCLFNNVAVAARHALEHHGLERVLVLDWDVHHGNGTAEIFAGTAEVLFVSIHQWPLYPGTGAIHEVGTGPGEGYTVNLPVPAGSGDDLYVSLIRHLVDPLARAYEPQLVLVSAGYDAHRDDPLADCRVTEEGYGTMAGLVRQLCRELGDVPVGAVLEGGYDLRALARSVAATLEMLDSSTTFADVEVHPLTASAADAFAQRWPALRAVSDAGRRT